MLLSLENFALLVSHRMPELKYNTKTGLFGIEKDGRIDSVACCDIQGIIAREADRERCEDAIMAIGADMLENDFRELDAGIERGVTDDLASDDNLVDADSDQ